VGVRVIHFRCVRVCVRVSACLRVRLRVRLQDTIFSTVGITAPVTRFDDDDIGEVEPDARASKLKLIYRGVTLEDGKVFDDYEWRKERWKWSKPYAGVVWISPFHPEPKYRSLRKPAAV
jgi:hypothetical protein